MTPNQRILIVDDDRTVTVWLATLFRRFGFAVNVAEDGIQAIAVTRQHRPDLILVDLNMPAGNGLFVLESLKKNPDLCGISVVLMSGDPSMDAEFLMSQGADACLSKAVDAIALLQTVRDVLERRSGTAMPAMSDGTWG